MLAVFCMPSRDQSSCDMGRHRQRKMAECSIAGPLRGQSRFQSQHHLGPFPEAHGPQASKGDAYLSTPADDSPDNNFNQDLAWGGWEYSALTRNENASKVIRVDRATGVTSQIWAAGQPATANEPRG